MTHSRRFQGVAAPIVATLLSVGAVSCTPVDSGADPEVEGELAPPSLVGSWRLESWILEDGSPRCRAEEAGPFGQIMYSIDGHMSVQLGCAGITLEGIEALEPQEAVSRVLRRFGGYYGTYVVNQAAQTVTHHVLGHRSPGAIGTDHVRSFVFEGKDRLVLTPVGSERRLIWVRN